jgi:type II secretory pathway component PulF
MILTPALMIVIASLIGLVIAGLMMPMARLIQWITG